MQTRLRNKKAKWNLDPDAYTSPFAESADRSEQTSEGEASGDEEVRISREDIRSAYAWLHRNMEPCYQGEWRRAPWDVKPYTSFTDYVIAHDVGDSIDSKILETGLTTMLTGDDRAMLEGDSPTAHGTVRLKEFPPRCKMGMDVRECSVWGLDCFTRKMLHDCLQLCPELMATSRRGKDVRSEFIETHLLPALNTLGDRGWSMFEGMKVVKKKGQEGGNAVLIKTAERMLQLMQCLEMREWTPQAINQERHDVIIEATDIFRCHPKGQGVICCRPGGLPKGTFVEEYLGEVYSPWRWFERQDAIKKLHPDSDLPDFYNIQIERPRADDLGYGVIFVEGANRGNYASRLCHSCSPNCQTVSLCAEGRVTNAIFTLRHISEGEELTWDYSCVTESEKEYRAAICLCGTSGCRGSFLFYADSSAFRDVMCEKHSFLDRTALLLRACGEELTQADQERLGRHGIKSYVFQAEADPAVSIPDWLRKWAALILQFVEYERCQLPTKLTEKYSRYTPESAQVEANGVYANRLQNLVITLDKAKYFLRKQSYKGPPVRYLTEEEVMQHLWTGEGSAVSQAMAAMKDYHDRLHRNQLALQSARKRQRDDGHSLESPKKAETDETLTDHVAKIHAFYKSYVPKTANQVRQGIFKICEMLRSMHPAHVAVHDVLFLKASTKYYVKGMRYETVTSAPVDLSDVDLPKAPNGESASKRKRNHRNLCKKYKSEFLWAQLVAWFKQTVYDPTASLGADRRGCVCLPSIDNCYAEPVLNGEYLLKQRPHMIRIMEQKIQSQWPTGTIWSYKNVERVYGTPMLDVAIGFSTGDTQAGEKFHQMLQEFKSVFHTSAFDVKPASDQGTDP